MNDAEFRRRREKLRRKWKDFRSGKELMIDVLRSKPYPLILCSFSGGRDSLAATLLTLDALEELGIEHRCHIVFNNTTNEFPETVRYVRRMFDWFQHSYPDLNIKTVETFPKVKFADLKEEMFYVAVKMYAEGRWDKSKLVCCDMVKLDPIRRFLRHHTINVIVSGLRGDESRQRYLSVFFHSPIQKGIHKPIYSFNKRGGVKVIPLWDWSAQDVQHFLENHPKRPPLNPLYQRGATSIGCMLCPIPFIFNKEEIRAYYPKKLYDYGLSLLRKALERTGQTLITSYTDYDLMKKEILES